MQSTCIDNSKRPKSKLWHYCIKATTCSFPFTHTVLQLQQQCWSILAAPRTGKPCNRTDQFTVWSHAFPVQWHCRFIISCRSQICLCFCSSIDSFWLLFFWNFKNKYPKKHKNPIFFKKYSENQKIFKNKMYFFFQFYIFCVNFSRIGP